MPELSPARRRELKARAHALDPVVLIGGAGLSPAVLAEIDRGLKNHELIKVRVPGADHSGREAILAEICRRTGAQSVQHIGKILVLFRENPEPSPGSWEDSLRRIRRGR
ncbi:MAG: ribosome assembly RNA-binding protein YhbY [Betaproteobacteria bacterium]|nr:MAG: ribosome assembly RNA-binding protein YhbY [Betaproteobacteria bacterium]TMG78777.1 MAG: ribosome assembly RNA-binding protein YhbY [Betaproteobacteria bacterium]